MDEYAKKLGVSEANLAECEEKITQLTQTLAKRDTQYDNQLSRLKSELESYLAASSILRAKKGVVTEIIPNHVMLGVQSVYSNRAVLNIDGRDVYLDVGESHPIKTDATSCNLWLIKLLDNDEVEIQLVCDR